MQAEFDKSLEDARLSTAGTVPLSLSPLNPFETGLILLLCDNRVRVLSRVGMIYDVLLLSGKDAGVTQTMSHTGLQAQIAAAVQQYGFETEDVYLASCRRGTITARAASLPLASGLSGTALPGRFQAEAVGSTGGGGSSSAATPTKCTACEVNFYKGFRLEAHLKRFPGGLCLQVLAPTAPTVPTFKNLAACLADQAIRQGVSDNKVVASVITEATITALSGMSTKSLMCQSCKSCKQNGGNCCCARPHPIVKWQARVEIDGMSEPTAMIWEALGAVVYEENLKGDTIFVKPSEAHFLTNTDHFAQICNVTFTMRIKLKKYVSKRDGETTTNVQVVTMTEIEADGASGGGSSSTATE